MSINKITESNILDSDTSTEFQFSLFIIVFFCLKVQSIKKIFLHVALHSLLKVDMDSELICMLHEIICMRLLGMKYI